MKKTGDPE